MKLVRMLALASCLGGLAACSGNSDDTLPTPDAGRDAELPDAAVEACPTETSGPTMHAGDIDEDQTWSAETSPHVITGTVRVRSGATLTVAPCAQVQLAANTGIHVAFPGTPNSGALVAEGTERRPIVFESVAADVRWDRIYVVAPGTLRLAHATLRAGGGTNSQLGESIMVSGDSALPSDGLVRVDHVTVEGSRGPGLVLEGLAKFQEGSRALTIRGSGEEAHPFPIVLNEHALGSLPDGSYTGNLDDRILIDSDPIGGLREDSTLHDRGVPYLTSAFEGQNGDFRVEATEGSPPVRLTIEPGVRMEFPRGSALEIGHFTGDGPSLATIVAVGTADKPIVFTSAQAAPAAGDWRGLWFGTVSSAENRLEHVRIEYSGADCGCILLTCDSDVPSYAGALIFSRPPPRMFMSNSTIAHGAANGVVQGYTGTNFDWTASNTMSDLAGCKQTRPFDIVEPICPDPRPLCVR